MPTPVRVLLAACVAIVGAAVALYWPAGSAWFFEDDLQWLAGSLTFEPVSLLDFRAHEHFYRPVIALYFWVAAPLFSGSAILFHWVNILLHAANALLVFLLAGTIGYNRRVAFLAAMFFVSMPAYVEAVAWVSALAEPVTTFFGCVSLYALLRARRERRRAWTGFSLASFFLALMTHESAAILLPLLVIADWAFVGRTHDETARASRAWVGRIRRFAPYALLLLLYLLIDLSINRRNYLVEEGHYRLGLHVMENLLGYIVSLYVGKRNLATFIGIGLTVTLLLLRGTPRVVFATAWLLLAILPFAFFTWGNTSRYAYMPAVGLALLLAEAVDWLDRRLGLVIRGRAHSAIIAVVAAFITIRFMLFTIEAVQAFSRRTESYRRFSETVRQHHPDPPHGARIPVDAATAQALQPRYLEALVQWEFRDPTLTIVVQP